MIIYATPFKQSTLECSGPSVDTGFKSLNDVAFIMPGEIVKVYPALIICGHGDDKVLFSRVAFHIDGNNNTD